MATESVVDIDPNAVHNSLRAFMQQLINAERERDDAFQRNAQLGGRVEELERERRINEEQLHNMQKVLAEVDEARHALESRLAGAQSTLTAQEETLKRADKERKLTDEKLAQIERAVAASENEKRTLLVRPTNIRLPDLYFIDITLMYEYKKANSLNKIYVNLCKFICSCFATACRRRSGKCARSSRRATKTARRSATDRRAREPHHADGARAQAARGRDPAPKLVIAEREHENAVRLIAI